MYGEKYLISIIIPVYNSENYIHDSFNSIKEQSIGFENIELIFVDDYSTDNSRQIIKQYSLEYDNVKCILLNDNSGFGGQPRNVGIQNATSDYIMFLDSDDIFYHDACEKLYQEIYNNDLDLVSGYYVTNDDGIKNNHIFFEKDFKLNNVFEDFKILIYPPAIMSKIYKKSVILENNIQFPIGVPGEDLVFSTNYFLHAHGISFIDFPVFEYVIRNSSIEKSVSYERNKTYLKGLYDSYFELYDLLLSVGEELTYVGLSRLNYWISQFIDSDLVFEDRVNLLKDCNFLFIEFEKNDNLRPHKEYNSLFKEISNKNFHEASKIAISIKNEKQTLDNLSILYDNLNNFNKALININSQLIMLRLLFENCSIDELFKGIDLIEKWDLFDYEYYRSKYNYTLNFNPLLHYLSIGHNQGKNPSVSFDGKFYESSNINIINSKLNPLLYFVLYGIDEGNVLINKDVYPYHKSINKRLLDAKIKNFNEFGVTTHKRDKKLIVSLTSFPERLYDIHYCIFSIFNQSIKPDEVVLWLASDQFPNGENDIPPNVLNLKKFGLKIKWCKDVKSYKKLIPALSEYPNDLIVTADDDLFYPKNWLELLYDEHKKNPKYIICQRSRNVSLNTEGSFESYNDWELNVGETKPSFINLSTNGAGSLFPPNSLHEDVCNNELFEKLCPTADDIWVWAMAILNKTKIKCVKNNMFQLTYINLARELNIINEKTLYSSNFDGGNDLQLKQVIDYYPDVLKSVKEDYYESN
ncbi:glycosyltransferase family 2 protein [Methanobrevibacter millerae]|uniref:Glycosyl transferase GT2 family n=1 Tax=Methanobrevibacter millerae TaxID=230361 RepID=A0A0U2V615_9EURY|nr:glycosyltransferase [Methanobrevibacter millerae]ALT69746.1 glycosyl transferase GT2 family [Methanobrevibacter millerae]